MRNLKEHEKKIIAPIIISVIMILYYIVYFGFIISSIDGIGRYALGILPVVFAVVTVKVCKERINEIKDGEEDDLGKY